MGRHQRQIAVEEIHENGMLDFNGSLACYVSAEVFSAVYFKILEDIEFLNVDGIISAEVSEG